MSRRSKFLLAFFTLMALVFVASVAGVVMMLRGGTGSSPDGSYLVIHLAGDLPEQPGPDDRLSDYFGGATSSVIDIDSSLRKAARDEAILGVIVKIDDLGIGMGKVQEIRDAISRFRSESDKRVFAWAESLGTKEYYLASACTAIYMPPEGLVFFNGLAFNVTFLKGTLDKLGVQAEFARIGRYKSAVEPMTREGMSEDYRQVMEELATDLFAQIVEGVAASRGLSREDVLALIDNPPLTAREAKERKLLDEIMYRDQLEDTLKQADQEEWSLVELADYQRVSAASLGLGQGPRIAVIYAEGSINTGESSSPGPLGGDRSVGSATLTAAIRQARKDEDIRAIVLRVDSPGGSALASDLMWRELELAQEKKPVVVSMSDYAASGGYYIAMGADAIVAQPATLTGSIGVFAGKVNLEGLYDKIGVHVDTVQKGRFANLFSGDQPFSSEERALLDRYIQSFYQGFVQKAAEGRKVSPEAIDAVARGRVWTGKQAQKVGLVDSLGGFREALRIAKERAKIDADQEVSLVLLPEPPSFLESFLGGGGPSALAENASEPLAPLARLLPLGANALAEVVAMAPLLASGQPLALMPFRVTVE